MGIVRWSSWRVFEGGAFVGWELLPFATFCDSCGQPPVSEVKGLTRRREDAKGAVGRDEDRMPFHACLGVFAS